MVERTEHALNLLFFWRGGTPLPGEGGLRASISVAIVSHEGPSWHLLEQHNAMDHPWGLHIVHGSRVLQSPLLRYPLTAAPEGR